MVVFHRTAFLRDLFCSSVKKKAFMNMVPTAILLALLGAAAISASPATLYGPAGPNGFEANIPTPRNLIGTVVFQGQAATANECVALCTSSAPTAKGFNFCDGPVCPGAAVGQCDCKTFDGVVQYYPYKIDGGAMSDGWYSGPVNGGGAPAAPAAPAAAGGAAPTAAGGAAAGPVTLAAEWDQKNLQGTVIKTTVLQYYDECAALCATTPGCKGVNFCAGRSACVGAPQGQCDIKSYEGAPQYWPVSGTEPGDGWISKVPAAAGEAVPAAAGGAAAGPVTLAAEWEQKNLKGNVIKTTVLPFYDECAALCVATPGCKGVNFCAGRSACGAAPQGQCDIKSYDGPPQYWAASGTEPGDGWISKVPA